MEWYWWVFIAASAVGLVVIKVLYAPDQPGKRQQKKAARQKFAEEDKNNQ